MKIWLQMAIEIPYILVQTIIYGVIVYAMMGFEWTVAKFMWFMFFTYFTFLYYSYYGMMTMALTPNHHVAAIASSAFYALWNIFSGFVIPVTVSSQLIISLYAPFYLHITMISSTINHTCKSYCISIPRVIP